MFQVPHLSSSAKGHLERVFIVGANINVFRAILFFQPASPVLDVVAWLPIRHVRVSTVQATGHALLGALGRAHDRSSIGHDVGRVCISVMMGGGDGGGRVGMMDRLIGEWVLR